MPTGQHYATNVPQTTLTAGIGAGTTNFAVVSLTSWPAPPFTAVLDLGQSNQEPIDVTAVSGNTITACTRAIDGTLAFSHGTNATLTHCDIGRDFTEMRSHIDAASSNDASGEAVHGLGNGSHVVGTTDFQTLTNKTLTSPTINTPTINGPGGLLTLPAGPETLVGRATTDTLTNKTLTSPTVATATFSGAQTMGSGTWTGTGGLSEASLAFTGLTGATSATSRFAGTVSGAAPTSGTFATGDLVWDTSFNIFWYCVTGGTPGTWNPTGRALLGKSTLGANAANVVFNIPSGVFRDVVVNWRTRSTVAAAGEQLFIRMNADTNSHYLWQVNQSNNATVAGTSSAGLAAQIQVGTVCGSASTSGFFSSGNFTISGVSDNTNFATVVGDGTAYNTATNSWTGTYGGMYNQAGPITSLTVFAASGNLLAGSTFSVWGIV